MEKGSQLKKKVIPLLVLLLVIAISVGLFCFYKQYPERIEQLKKVSQAPTVAVTVLFAQGKTQLTIVGTARATPEDIKFILQQGIDEITAQVVRQQLQAESGEQEPEGVPPEAVDPPE